MRRAVAGVALLALVLGGSGCAIFQVELPPKQPADELLAADRLFARRALQGTAAAVREFFEVKGVRLEPAGQAMIGREQIAAELGRRPGLLSWEPRFAEVSGSGDWGWTWGDWQVHEPGAGGRRIAQGRYMSLWKKQPDSTWQVHAQLSATEVR